MRIAYIVISGLVVCSMLAVAVASLDLSGFLDEGSDEVIVDPNADIIAEQRTVVAGTPEDVDQIVLLANLLANTGQMAEATEWYERAIELRPEDNSIRLDFARSLQTNGLSADAEAQFLRVLENDPESQSAHYYLAQLYLDWKPSRREEAAHHFTRAIEIDPDQYLAEQAQLELDALNRVTPSATPGEITPAAGP